MKVEAQEAAALLFTRDDALQLGPSIARIDEVQGRPFQAVRHQPLCCELPYPCEPLRQLGRGQRAGDGYVSRDLHCSSPHSQQLIEPDAEHGASTRRRRLPPQPTPAARLQGVPVHQRRPATRSRRLQALRSLLSELPHLPEAGLHSMRRMRRPRPKQPSKVSCPSPMLGHNAHVAKVEPQVA